MLRSYSPPPQSPLRLQEVGAAIRLVMKDTFVDSPGPGQTVFPRSSRSFELRDKDISDIFSICR